MQPLFSKDVITRVLSDSRVAGVVLALGVWVALCATLGSRYPYNYDSINYALGIVDDFDIGKCQPHAWGYLYHILVCRLWLPFVDNPFRIQQFQSIVYLLIAVLCMLPQDRKNGWAVLIPATVPLSLFFASTAVIHAASFAASAAIALLVLRLEEKKVHPLVLAVVFAVSIGFRQDSAVFMGPVVFIALLRRKCSLREWAAVIICGVLLTAVWYVATGVSSGGLSPYREANAIVKPFLQGTSLVYGASVRVWLWMVLRMVVYIPAVFGPGGLLLLWHFFRAADRFDRLYLAWATVPFFIYAVVLYAGLINYYASITGFVFAWILRRGHGRPGTAVVVVAVLLNAAYFAVVPPPAAKSDGGEAKSVLQAGLRLASWGGAAGRAAVLKNRKCEIFLDNNVASCRSFSSAGQVEYNGIPVWRAWNIMGERVWHTVYSADTSRTECVIRPVREGEHPDRYCDGIGVWYHKDMMK